ncbi:MAG: hypothetical protein U0263_09715 [Polyangiaceae bacterium]
MSVGSLFFAVCALVALVGAVSTVAAGGPIRGAVGLLANRSSVGRSAEWKLAAQFLAAIQLMVYAGAGRGAVLLDARLGPDAGLGDSLRVVRPRWAGASASPGAGVLRAFGRAVLGKPLAGWTTADFGSTDVVGTAIKACASRSDLRS